MLDSIFEQLGLGKRETETYLALLECGAVTAGGLAKRMSIPRSSLYGYLNLLLNQGLVTLGERDSVQIWQAESPNKLRQIVGDRAEHWKRKVSDVERLLPSLLAQQNTDLLAPSFTYYEGIEGVKQILKDMLLYRDMSTQAFWPIKDMIDILGADFFYEHNVQRIRQNLSVQALWPSTKVVDISKANFLGIGKAFRREIRVAPSTIDCTMGYWAYSNKIAFLSSRKECFGFIVESVEMRQMLKTQFDLIWNLSERIEVEPSKTERFLKDNFS